MYPREKLFCVCAFRVPFGVYLGVTHNDIVIELRGDIVSRLLVVSLINGDNSFVRYIAKFKLGYNRSSLAENCKCLLYK